MSQKPATSCSKLLEKAAFPMLERARKLSRLEKALHGLLPDNLAAHCKVMNLKREILILGTDSSTWATHLRFAAPGLIKQLQCQFSLNVRTIEVRIEPESRKSEPKPKPMQPISLANGNLLAQTARSVDHRGLQEALYRLAAKCRDF